MAKFKSIKQMNKKLYKRTLLDEIKYYGFYCWWNYLDMLPRRIYWFFQRGFRGYGDCDVWDFDLYLAKIISNGLKQLKKEEHGCPGNIYNKYFIRKNLTQKQKDKLAIKEWNIILDIIIRGFELVPELFEMEILKNKKLKDNYMCKLEQAFDLMKKYYFNFWD